MEGLHELFHVVLMFAFLICLAAAFVGFAGRLLYPEERGGVRGSGRRFLTPKASLALGAGAAAALAADWIVHNLAGP